MTFRLGSVGRVLLGAELALKPSGISSGSGNGARDDLKDSGKTHERGERGEDFSGGVSSEASISKSYGYANGSGEV